jgi:putative transposase
MITTLLHLLRLFPFLCGGHRQLALENLALRQQLTVYRRTVARPRLRRGDRLFWVALSRLWRGWKQALVIVAPDTVLCWQRRRFRDYWTRRSRRSVVGRPPVAPELRALVAKMAAANPLWGAPRIHGELLKLGIDVAERTVSRLMPKRRPSPSQTWRTFLTNHVRDLVSIDFFTVSTAHLRVYHGARTHLSLEKDAPDARPVERPAMGTVVPIPEVGGLHHRYVRRAA